MTDTLLSSSLPAVTTQAAVENGGLRRWRWSSAQYERLAELGFFEGRRVELIDGEVIEMAAMNAPHATALGLVEDALRNILRVGFFFRVQLPLGLGEQGQPEPDVAIVSGQRRDFRSSHPQTAVLVVEVSDSTLLFDRTDKANLYASAGIPEYWILNLQENQLEIYRQPVARPEARFGWSYAAGTVARSGESTTLLAAPDASIAVSDLLP